VNGLQGDDLAAFDKFFTDYMSKNGDSKITTQLVTGNQTIQQYVYEKQKANYMASIRDYYGGFEFRFDQSDPKSFYLDIQTSGFAKFTSTSTINDAYRSVGLFYYMNKMIYFKILKISSVYCLISFTLAYLSQNPSRSIKSKLFELVDKREKDNSTVSINFQCFEIIPFSVVDMLNGLLISFIISLNTIVLIRERNSGSKSLQLLHGTHFSIYWLANYVFDFIIYFISILSILITLEIVSIFDKNNEAYIILGLKAENFIYLFIFLIISSLSWSTIAYIGSFVFKRDIVGFVVLFLILSGAVFIDMVMVIIGLIEPQSDRTIRTLLALFFPGVTVKKTLYNLKKQNLPECLDLEKKLCNIILPFFLFNLFSINFNNYFYIPKFTTKIY